VARCSREPNLRAKPNKAGATAGYPGLLLLAAAWTIVGSLAYARHYLLDPAPQHGVEIALDFVEWLSCFYPWVVLAPIVFRLERRYSLDGPRRVQRLAILAAAGVPLSYVGTEISLALVLAAELLFHTPLNLPSSWWKQPFGELGFQALVYVCTVAAAYVVRKLIELRQRERETAELALQKARLESDLHRAELESLRARLNPHFLFNSLQNISVLIQEDPRTASRMLARLGDVLRAALRLGTKPEISLASEIELTRNYVAVEQMRFGERLAAVFEIEAESQAALVPPFVLQPLVENAIVHGLQEARQRGVIRVRSHVEGKNLTLTVADNGSGVRAGSLRGGVGLSSTRERLARMYPERHCLELRPLPEGGTEARIVLPFRVEATSLEAAAHEQTASLDC
jgi:two-component system, LytTR family, sensor kinase